MPRFDRSPPESNIYSALSPEQELAWAPDLAQELDPYLDEELEQVYQSIIEEDDKEAIEIALRKQTWRNRLHKILAATAALMTVAAPVNTYARDVIENKERASLSRPTIDPIYPEDVRQLSEETQKLVDLEAIEALKKLNAKSSIFYLAGFDTVDGSVYGERVSPALHQIVPGEDESINYGEAPLNPEEIGEQIIELAKSQNKTRISLAGNSLGGIITLQTALYIMENSDLEIDAIFNNATPNGSKGLRPETKKDLATMMDWLEKIPESKYSDAARTFATIAQESPRFTDGDLSENISDFITVYNETRESINEKRRPGMWLLVDQALAVTNADLQDIINRIGALRGTKHIPYLVNFRPTDAADDAVVDVANSSEEVCGYAITAGVQCSIAFVEGQRHTSYDFNTDAFAEALAANGLAKDIRDGIARERTYYSMVRLDIYTTENILAE